MSNGEPLDYSLIRTRAHLVATYEGAWAEEGRWMNRALDTLRLAKHLANTDVPDLLAEIGRLELASAAQRRAVDQEINKAHDLAVNYVRATRHQLDLIERWLSGESANLPTMGAFSQDAVRLAECMARYGALAEVASHAG